MLVFNCTKAAAEFFTVTRQGKKQSPLKPSPKSAIGDTQHNSQPVSPWLVHATKVQRKNVLIAMHVPTRYAMVFTGLKKGDWTEFFNQCLERLFNNMQFFGEAFELCDEASFHTMFNQFLRLHPKLHFCQRGDRSVQSHLNDVVWHFEYRVHEAGCLPDGQEQCASFDEWVNSMIRSTKSHKDYFHPDEEMFLDWISQYGDLDESEEPLIRQYFHSLRVQTSPSLSEYEKTAESDALMNAALNEYYENLNSIPDNVIDLNQARARKNKK
ncbi:DUF6933 domain-containing protein [Vibrio quintilis]|uniref:DUF6933 domain-containing protein n=1 Tax=Vibrio quintilis TaxID=1117707 RepID=A0A1M7YX22_9VIBR|nr:hypothetical protein [Vibrio quintilis]SHO57046.1 hypothetical protein VQ7734_02815 [Vibrio quintilis]